MPIKPLTDFQKKILLDLIRNKNFTQIGAAKKYGCSQSLINIQLKNICKKYDITYWGTAGARIYQTIDEIRGAVKNDRNRQSLQN